MEERMRKLASFSIGAVLGGMVGGVLALIFAPKSGLELRSLIKNRFNILSDDVQQAVQTKRIELQNRLDNLRSPKV
jgi:gas vesicle protein